MVACPFAGTAAARPASTPSACPFASGAQGPNGDSQAAQHDEPAAVCPYGYGADAGPKLSELDCTICQTLLFDASKAVPCGHKFCRYCLSKFKDCPLCGADVAGIESAKDLQGTVDAFLTAHSKSPGIVGKQYGYTSDALSSVASFYMELGYRSYAGGNLEAALDRLGRCQQHLEQEQQAAEAATIAASAASPYQQTASGPGTTSSSTSSSSSTSAACKQAAVAGCMGDCHRRMNDLDSAASSYAESISCLRDLPEGDAEAMHALSVSYNKMGDLHFLKGDVPAACEDYRRGLSVRRRLLRLAPHSTEAALDTATSLIKVADACKAVGCQAEVAQHAAEAKAILEQLERLEGGAQLDGPTRGKLERLKSVLYVLLS